MEYSLIDTLGSWKCTRYVLTTSQSKVGLHDDAERYMGAARHWQCGYRHLPPPLHMRHCKW